MAKGKYTSKFTSVTAELFNDYYEDTNTVISKKMANNAASQKTNNVSTKQNKAVLSSKPQKKQNLKKQNNSANKKVITQSLKQTASFLNNKQKYQQEFPTLGQSYKSQTTQKPQPQMKQQQQQIKKQQPQKLFNKTTAPRTYRSPATYTTKQTEELLRQFYSLCQSYNGMNYFGKAVFQNCSWSKNQNGQWLNSASALALKNAPIVRKMQRQASVKKQPMKQLTRQASVKKQQPSMKMGKQQAEKLFLNEFSEISQLFNGMSYFGKSSYQENSWAKNRQGQWVSKASSISLKNAPIVRKVQTIRSRQASAKKQPVQQKAPIRQAPVKKQPVQQKAPVRQAPVKKQPVQQRKMKKQQRSMKPVVNSAITMEQKQMNQKMIVAQQNASMKLQQQILKQFNEKQQQLEKKKKLEQQQKLKQQQQLKIQKKNAEKKAQTVKQPTNLKKQQLEKEKKRVQKAQKTLNKGNKLNNKTKRNVRQMSRSQAKKLRKKQQLVNTINKRIQELVAEKQQKQLFSQMVKQKAEQILEEKHELAIQKSIALSKKEAQGNKLREKESFDKQQKQIQKKLTKQKSQIKQKVNKKNSQLEAQKKKQLAELRNNLTPEQFNKIQSIMQQKGNNTKEQNERQLQSEQAKKNWQEQVRKMKARQQDVQQKQEKQSLMKKRLESIKRKLTPKQQENLMNKLKIKEQQKQKTSQLKNRQPRANNNNKKFVKRAPINQAPVKQAPVKKQNTKQMNKKTEVWTFVSYNKNSKVQKPVQKNAAPKPVQQKSKNVKQFKTILTRKFNASETKMYNTEFTELCNVFESTKYVTYSNYKTWSMNKSGRYVSNASVIAARNAPRITRGLSKQMFFGKKMNMKTQNVKPQQVRNKKNNRSRC
ncbi:hypothetical protein BCR36DRAFT_578888 [Piromyces finnis]|uniref:Uncharacterized protein n=1 Tax=Piromyces finnis TaxID=1754191 RepID=A0A1Y1VPM0_9FUNG|nr:hypothetical protein BCR36DRAFT_578888 [Piromyces finnis]|eukprot:ORX60811.1 hypothetical protein BCR36DRAFT_578888 [Piromyces finnis]